MNKKTIKKLALITIRGDLIIDEGKIKKIFPILKRDELKAYLRELKEILDKNTVYVTIPSNDKLTQDAKRIFSKTFPGKNIKVAVDPSLISGVRIKNYDMIYELSLRAQLEEGLRSIVEDEN